MVPPVELVISVKRQELRQFAPMPKAREGHVRAHEAIHGTVARQNVAMALELPQRMRVDEVGGEEGAQRVLGGEEENDYKSDREDCRCLRRR